MFKNPLAAALLIVPLALVVASCASILDVDFGAAHLDDDASTAVTGDGSVSSTGAEGGQAACVPKTCAAQGFQCGTQKDGCGNALECGSCESGTCTAGKCACVPKTCPELSVQCGKVDNGCGGILDCGGCANASETCDSTSNTCVCKPKNCAAQGAACGTVPDGCGQTYACGECMAPTPNCTAGKCGAAPCVPKSCSDQGKNCGQVSDGCGNVLPCGTCNAPQSCGGAGTANVCGCTPKTCAQLGATCGSIGDGCGGTLSCGSCTSPETCGGGGTANACGCTPTGKCPTGANCGTVPNGCGGNVACGAACVSPSTCGGGGTALVCGCTPLTCDDFVCGTHPNGCGGTLYCGTCGGCFAGDTPVLMADGSTRPISTIVAGDVIMGVEEATQAAVPHTVVALAVHPPEDSKDGTLIINESIRTTRNHPFLSGGKRVRADQLKVGDVLHVANVAGPRAPRVALLQDHVTSIRAVEGGIVSYDITTSPPGGYIVGGIHAAVSQKIAP